jgi:hypothetical protein
MQLLRDVPGATVILDRRRGERRRARGAPAQERRRLDRRVRRPETNSLGYAMVRFAVKPTDGSASGGRTGDGASEPPLRVTQP